MSVNQTALTYNKSVIAFLFGIFILAVTAQLSIPLKPVPISMQTFAILYIGLIYTKRSAILTICSYVLLGAVGLPVFTNFSSGLGVLLSPRGGYLIGFVFSILAMVHIREYLKQNFLGTLATCIVGSIIVYTFGVTWLSTFVGIKQAITLGFIPFIIPGIVKAFILSAAIRYTKL